jgi:AraC-like DNA-binding protein
MGTMRSERPGTGEIVEAASPEAAENLLRSAYGDIRIDVRGQRSGMRLARVPLTPSVRLDHITFAMSLSSEAAPLGALVFGTVRSGLISHKSGGGHRLLRPGDVYLAAQPDFPHAGSIVDAEAETAVIDPSLPSQVADTRPGRAQQPVRFTGYRPVSAQAGRAWKDTYAYVRDTVLHRPETAGHQLIISSAARLLVATALVTFPNNALTEPTSADRRDAHTVTLRRAVAFIDEHAHEDISVADVAAAAQVTLRAIQLAFRRHLGVTPGAYLRRVRLDHAHRELAFAAPGRQTVTAVAYRWGFSSPSRFAALYRRAYGVVPSHTLHQD